MFSYSTIIIVASLMIIAFNQVSSNDRLSSKQPSAADYLLYLEDKDSNCGVGGNDPTRNEGPSYSSDSRDSSDSFDSLFGESTGQSRIINGITAEQNAWLWTVQIKARETLCGGVLINDRWVVTVGHCINRMKGQNYRVVLGNHRNSEREAGEIEVNAELVIKHRLYDSAGIGEIVPSIKYDIALLRLPKSVARLVGGQSTTIGPICLAKQSRTAALRSASQLDRLQTPFNATKIRSPTRCVSVGWGLIQEGVFSDNADVLQQIDVRVLNLIDNQCETEDGVFIPLWPGFVCQGPVDGTQPGTVCNGDSGAPTMCYDNDLKRWYLLSLTSSGPRRCTRQSIYTRWSTAGTDVSYNLNWIRSVTREWTHRQVGPLGNGTYKFRF